MLLIAPPIHTTLIDSAFIDTYMHPYAHDLIASKAAISQNKHRADPFGDLVDLDALIEKTSSSSPAEPDHDHEREEEKGAGEESAEFTPGLYYVESIDEGIDHYMFPRAMGYLILEKQYEL